MPLYGVAEAAEQGISKPESSVGDDAAAEDPLAEYSPAWRVVKAILETQWPEDAQGTL